MVTYKVIEIQEPDFGCEGRMDGEMACATVKLLNMETQESTMIKVPDAELYEKDILEGMFVAFENNVLTKINDKV